MKQAMHFILAATISLSLLAICKAGNNPVLSVNKICSTSTNKTLCTAMLQRCNCISSIDDIGTFVSGKATSKIKEMVDKLVPKNFVTCKETMGNAIDNLNMCHDYFQKKKTIDFNSLKTKADSILTDVTTCEDEYARYIKQKKQKTLYHQSFAEAKNIIDVLLVILNNSK
ncbi:hypothetical protein CASFOL_021132 [Castilleja foliolosa]|uniref:Pectinesterase inhibitor domain-containing protein n=1 Tax=Castilleja foliolosa TaxID=1961234 RepID=A0ABD3CVN7_9LAMI